LVRKRILLLAAALAVGILALSFSLAVSAAGTRPDVAAAIAPYLSAPKSRIAEVLLAAGMRSGDLTEAASQARAAALTDPLDVAAVRTLGFVRRTQKNDKQADALFAYANRLTRRDLGVNLDSAMQAAKRGDVNGTVHSVDLSLRTSVESWDRLFPLIYRISGDPAVVPALARVLQNNPQWKWPFLDGLVREGPDPVMTARLFAALEKSGPLNNDDLNRALIARLVEADRYPEALARYSSFAKSKGVRSLTNGDFERAPLGAPFEWTSLGEAALDTGVSKNATDQAEGNSFYFRIPGGEDGELLRLTALLDQGPHRLSVVLGPALEGTPGSLVLNAECLSNGATIASETVDHPAAGSHAFSFLAPSNCPAVRLYLRANSADDGTAWVSWLDRLVLDPAGAKG
jgi:hypothetical protein